MFFKVSRMGNMLNREEEIGGEIGEDTNKILSKSYRKQNKI